jgi:hypothetical protein
MNEGKLSFENPIRNLPKLSDSVELKVLSPEEASNLIFWANYYGQGRTTNDIYLSQLVALRRPELRFPTGDYREKAYNLTRSRIAKFLENAHLHRSIQPDEIGASLTPQFDTWADSLNSRNITKTLDDLATSLVAHMIERDYTHLHGKTPRPRDIKQSPAPFNPSLSQFTTYVLRGEKGPGPEVLSTDMLGEMRKVLNSPEIHERLKGHIIFHGNQMFFEKALQSLVMNHNVHNPEKKIDESQFPYLFNPGE